VSVRVKLCGLPAYTIRISSPKGSKELTYKIMQGILMGMIASLTSTTFFIAEYTEIRKHVNLRHESQPKLVLDFLG
jgi:hypothetical protein